MPAALDDLCPQCLMSAAASALAHTGDSVHYFGDYELIQEIARGGMGIVYAARQKSLNRIVALKRMLHPALAGEVAVRRFRTEAEAAARLRHPNIVGIYEVGEHEGEQYFSMEYIEGRSLAETLHDGPLAPRRAAEILRAIAGAVAYAHQQGVLHRDLKPSNVLMDEREQPHVTDFGLAKLLASGADITLSGQVLGTPSYISPEQAAGKRATHGPAMDIYSLGAVLYHLLIGRPPFAAEDAAETLRQARETDPAPPRLLNPSVPADLETICLKCLEKETAKRYASAQDLADDLGRFLSSEPIHARPVTRFERAWRWCRREPALAGAIGAVALLLVVIAVGSSVAAFRINTERAKAIQERANAIWYRQLAETNAAIAFSDRQRAETNALLEAAQRRQAEDAMTEMLQFALKADDANIALAYLARAVRQNPTNKLATEQLVSTLAFRDFATPAFPPLPHSAPVQHAQFSPDGARILTSSADGLARIWDAAAGRQLLELRGHTGAVSSAKFSLDGRSVVTAGADGTVRVWDATTGEAKFPPFFHRAPWSTADFSPDGALIAAVRKGAVFFWDARSGESLTGVAHSPALALRGVHHSVPFSPDSQSFLEVDTNRVRLVTVGKTNRIVKRLGGGANDPLVTHAAFSPDGTRVVAAAADDMAYLWDITTNTPGLKLSGHDDNVVFAQFSPDGSRIVTGSTDKTARLWDGHTGRLQVPPLLHDGWVVFAQFSADGLKFLTLSDDRTVRVWDATTGQRIGEPIAHQSEVLSAEFSPDGARLVIAAGQPYAQVWDIRPSRARAEIHHDLDGRLSLEGKFDANGRTLVGEKTALWRLHSLTPPAEVRRLLGAGVATAELHWGPHGSWFIARQTNDDCRLHSYPAGEALTAPLAHPGPVMNVAFSPEGRLCLTVGTNHVGRLWEARTGRLLHESFTHDGMILDPVFSPDGRRLLLASNENVFCFWDVASGQPVGEPFAPERNHITDAAFSPDGRRLVTTQYGSRGLLRDGETGQPIGEPLAHDQPFLCARFSPDGETLVTTSEDETARLWNARDGTPLSEPLRHFSPVLWAAFSPDSRRLATFCEDGTARLWDARSGQLLGQPMRTGRKPARGEFTSDGQRLVVHLRPSASTSEQPILRQVWSTPVPPLPVPPWLAGFAEAWAGRGIDAQGRMVRVESPEYFAARAGLPRQETNDFYGSLARWLGEDRATRPVAPGGTQRVPEHLGRLLEGINAATLYENGREAALLDPTNGRALAQLSLAWSARSKRLTNGTPSGSLAQALHLSRRATMISPKLAEAWLAYGQASGLVGGPAGALAAIEAGLKELPTDPTLLDGRAAQLGHLGRKEEAVAAYTEALRLTEAVQEAQAKIRQRMFQNRADLLEQLGRTEEAKKDRAKAGSSPAAPGKQK